MLLYYAGANVIQMSEQRSRVLQIRMTPSEHDRVTAEAEAVGMKASALGRERILSPNPPIISAREVDGGQEVAGGRVIYEDPAPDVGGGAVFKCPRDCRRSFRPTSEKMRCPECRRQVVPA